MSEPGTEREETTNEKGDRHENEARHILKRVYGAGVSKVGCRGVHDPFGFVDLIAMRPGEPVKFVQVKTNGFSAEARRKYRRRTRKLPTEHAVLEVWVRHDRQGWVLHEYDPEAEEFRQFHEIGVCDRSDAGDEYREFVERQEQIVTDGSGEPGTDQEPLHTQEKHEECGSYLYRAGSDRELFCVACGSRVADGEHYTDRGTPVDVDDDQEFHLCEVLVDYEEGMSVENIDQKKCPGEAVGKFRYETEYGYEDSWLCEVHREDFEIEEVIRRV